jgi:hypothetical protein
LYNGWAEFVGVFRKCLRISNRPDEAGRAADADLAILGFALALGQQGNGPAVSAGEVRPPNAHRHD